MSCNNRKILSVVGARPQFIKLAPVSKAIRGQFREVIVHTGQHYDANMSRVFFEVLHIPAPDYNLGIGSDSHGTQTGKMMIALEKVVLQEQPDLVMVFGDTNSTLAGALVAAKLHIPLAHVEAGLRSYNKTMPEEINRVLSDHVSDFLFCPSQIAVENLAKEGITRGVHFTGDVMYDALLENAPIAQTHSHLLETLSLEKGGFYLATVHRPATVDNSAHLETVIAAFEAADLPVVFPVHPRTRQQLQKKSGIELKNIRCIEPVGYLDMIALIGNARKVITDSGGVQKEAYFLRTPCITVRSETEWTETVTSGWNRLVEFDRNKLAQAITEPFLNHKSQANYYGDGQAAVRICQILTEG